MSLCLISLIWVLCFLVFSLIQSLFINGVYEAFRGTKENDITNGVRYKGNILFMIAPKFIHENRDKMWAKPLWGCIKCQSSFYGAITFWPTVLFVFGFQIWQIPIYFVNVGVLTTLNYWIFKKL